MRLNKQSYYVFKGTQNLFQNLLFTFKQLTQYTYSRATFNITK